MYQGKLHSHATFALNEVAFCARFCTCVTEAKPGHASFLRADIKSAGRKKSWNLKLLKSPVLLV